MATYTTISASEIDADSPITDTLLQRFRDNPIAITEGASGAPRNQATSLNTATNTLTGSIPATSEVTLTLGGYAFFPAVSMTGGSADLGISGAAADGPQIRLVNPTGSTVSYTVRWRAIY